MERNTMSKTNFLYWQLLLSVIAMALYYAFFRTLGFMSDGLSKLFLWSLVAVSIALGIAAAYRRKRNILSIITNILFPFEIYTALAYQAELRPIIIGALLAAIALSLAYSLPILLSKIRGKRRSVIFRRRIWQSVIGSRTIFSLCMTVVLACMSIPPMFGYWLDFSGTRSTDGTAGGDMSEEDFIDENMETICLLDDEAWQELSLQVRVDVLQTIADVEQRRLGVPYRFQVVALQMDEDMLGGYDATHGKIVINEDFLGSCTGFDAVETIAHEAHHGYERCQVALYEQLDEETRQLKMFDRIRLYRDEFASYASGSTGDFSEYWFQACESDCRDYAEDAVSWYQGMIEYWYWLKEIGGES